MDKYIIYVSGRFGPERIIGYVYMAGRPCFKETTHLTFTIVKPGFDEQRFITNPLGISSLAEYRKWQRRQSA